MSSSARAIVAVLFGFFLFMMGGCSSDEGAPESTAQTKLAVGCVGPVSLPGNVRPLGNVGPPPVCDTTTIASSQNPSVTGQSVTFTAMVISGGSPPAAGTVTFLDGATPIGAGVAGVPGNWTFTTTALSVGSHSITATYANAPFPGSTSAPLTQVVNQAATVTSLMSATNPTSVGGLATFVAHVTAASPGGGVPTGDVTFSDGAAVLGTGPVDGAGDATFATAGLTAGTHTITATYGGSVSYAASTSPSVNQGVVTSSATVALVSSVNPSTSSRSVTFTATLSGSNGTPSGTVTFTDGPTTLGTGSLTGGVATLVTAGLAVGSHNIVATYGGDVRYSGGSTGTVVQIVKKAATTIDVTSSVNPSTFGQLVTFTATLTSALADNSGEVEVFDGAFSLGKFTLVTSAADTLTATITLSTATLPVGVHVISATYAGDALHDTSGSLTFTQTVNAGPTSSNPGPAPSAPGATSSTSSSGAPSVQSSNPSSSAGCGCHTTSSGPAGAAAVLPLLGLALLFARRRRPRQS